MFKNLKNIIALIQKSQAFQQEKSKSFKIKFFFAKTKKMEPAEKPAEKTAEPQKKKELAAGTLEDFVKVEIRVGEIIECWKVIFLKFFHRKSC